MTNGTKEYLIINSISHYYYIYYICYLHGTWSHHTNVHKESESLHIKHHWHTNNISFLNVFEHIIMLLWLQWSCRADVFLCIVVCLSSDSRVWMVWLKQYFLYDIFYERFLNTQLMGTSISGLSLCYFTICFFFLERVGNKQFSWKTSIKGHVVKNWINPS